MRPILHQFRIFGIKNGLMYDHNQETFIKIRGERYKSYLEKFIPPVNFSKQYRSNGFYNIKIDDYLVDIEKFRDEAIKNH